METILTLFSGIILGTIGYQDFRTRKISLIALVCLLLISLWISSSSLSIVLLCERVILNSLLALILLVSGTLLVKFLRKPSAVKDLIGAGDFLFLISISPLFSFEFYLVFLNTSLLISLLFSGGYHLFSKSGKTLIIPLAGIMALCVLLEIAIKITFHFSCIAQIASFLL